MLFTLSKISQRMTYYEKYQDAWDIMVTLKDTQIESFEETDELQRLTGVQSGVVYQRAKAKRILTQEEISEDLTALNGMRNAPEKVCDGFGGRVVGECSDCHTGRCQFSGIL